MFDDAMQNPQNQIKAIRSFIAYKVDVIAFSPLEKGWDTVLGEAKAAGIPVIIVDRDSIRRTNCTRPRSARTSTWKDAAPKSAGQEIPGSKTAGSISWSSAAPLTPRPPRTVQGFRDVISLHPQFRVTFSEDGDFMLSKGREIMQKVLKRYSPKDIDVLYSTMTT